MVKTYFKGGKMAKTIIQDFTLNQLHYNWGNSVTNKVLTHNWV